MAGNWFCVHRQYDQCDAIGSDWTLAGAWLAILSRACYQPTTFKGERIARGEFGFTYRQLQAEWCKSPTKIQEVLSHFTKHKMIEVRRTKTCSICRVLNYERYQGNSVTDSVTGHPAEPVESVTESVTHHTNQGAERYRSSNAERGGCVTDGGNKSVTDGSNATEALPYWKNNLKKQGGAHANTIPPKSADVIAYAEQHLGAPHPEMAEAFFDHFTSNGWKVGGRARMKDWQAAFRRWARRERDMRPGSERIVAHTAPPKKD